MAWLRGRAPGRADRADIAQALRSAAGGFSVLDPGVQAALLAAVSLTAHEHAVATRKDTAGEREANPVYQFWHGHASALIAQARPGLDADLLAHALLGTGDPPRA